MRLKKILVALVATALIAGVAPAATDCTFTTKGATMRLDADCTTDATIFVPDGMTLDGRGHMITAVDPVGGFKGAVIANAGTTAHVKHLTVTASMLANSCKGGADRLRGIMFEAGSGSITHTTVTGINKGASGCQEGNAIEVRNAPFDGSHPGTVMVEVAHNKLVDWQKTGIVCNGDVMASVHHNQIFASATQDNLAANSLQFGFGAIGLATQNLVHGNQWKGTSNFAASAILVYLADATVSKNNVRGNSDIGLFVVADGGTYDNNRIFDEGPDHPNSGYDIGLGDFGTGNAVTRNKVRGFDDPYDPPPAAGGNNKVIPGPQRFK